MLQGKTCPYLVVTLSASGQSELVETTTQALIILYMYTTVPIYTHHNRGLSGQFGDYVEFGTKVQQLTGNKIIIAIQVGVIFGGNRRVVEHIEGSFSGKQIGVVPLETRRQTFADIFRCDNRDVLEGRDEVEVSLAEHHKFHPEGVHSAPALREKVTERTEIALDLRGSCLVAEHLPRDWRD